MAQPCRGQVQGGLPVRKCTDDARAPPDLAQNALERVVIWHVLTDASSIPQVSAALASRDEGVGSTRYGQAVPYHELRARVVIKVLTR